VIESNLNTAATSQVGAGGPWQFMPYTARDYGLTVNSFIDDRRDYFKSTHAASKYLLNLYKQFHDWLLVMAAYNGGPARVYDAIKKSGSNNFWDLQYYLPEESRVYVKRFIATHYIMEGTASQLNFYDSTISINEGNTFTNYGKLHQGLNPYSSTLSLSAKEMEDVQVLSISGKYNSSIIARNIVMDIHTFNHYNPLFDVMIANNGNYELRLPADKMEIFIANKYPILNECVQTLLRNTTIPEMKTVYKKAVTRKKKKY
jgi:membrane-bound lytic murein transglycosylase D